MIWFILVSILVIISFILFIINIIKLIFSLVSKKIVIKSNIIKSIIFGTLLAVLVVLNVVLFFIMINSDDPLFESFIDSSTKVVSKGLVATYDNIVEDWDKSTLKKVNKITISIIDNSEKIAEDKETKIYYYKLLLENKNSKGERLNYWNIFRQNLIYFLDANDVIFPAQPKDLYDDIIPIGKSYIDIKVETSKEIELKYIGFGERILPLN